MATQQLYVICYDISDDTRRQRIAAALEKVAVRVQNSVFEWRTTEQAVASLTKALAAQVRVGDSLRIYLVPDKALSKCEAIGGAPIPEPGDYFLF